MMKQLVFVTAVAVVLGGASAWAQEQGGAGGHTAPKTQPSTAPPPAVPTGELSLGSVSIPRAVKADGKALPAGTYQLRLTAQTAAPPAIGETPSRRNVFVVT